MKKISLFITLLSLAVSIAFGQTAPAAGTQNAPVKKDKTENTTVKPPPEEVEKLKKDGTPDKRYKQNKVTPEATGPKKKDGTPDKRYKENKEAAPKN